jgi:hypothetical protein
LHGGSSRRREATKLIASRAIGNAFQNIGRSRERFERFTIDPFASLNADELDFLRLNIEKRYVLAHNLGLADEKYAEVATTSQPGQTVVLARFAALAARVVATLEDAAFPVPQS